MSAKADIKIFFLNWALVVFLCLFFLINNYTSLFTKQTQQELDDLAQAYAHSQYIKGDAAKEKINDSTLYLYAGLAYWRGEDPTTINFEHPPIGKFIFGLSHAITGNTLSFNILILWFIIIVMNLLMLKLNLSFWFRQIGLIFITFGLSLNKLLLTGLLDSQLLLLTLLFFYLLIAWENENWSKYSTLGIVLGLLMGLKYFFLVFSAYLLIFGWWVWQKKHMVWLF